VWANLAKTRAPLKTWSVAMVGGGLSPRAMAAAWAQALGPCGRSKSSIRTLPATLRQA
jgi:hypothetical protein